MRIRCFNIKWDKDGAKVKLPKEVIVEVDDGLDAEELEETVSDAISDATGWCHKGFQYETISEVSEVSEVGVNPL